MLGSVSLSLASIKPAIAHATHQLAKQGQWQQVFHQIAAYPDIAVIADRDPVSSGWTLFDHAVFQKNIAAFVVMRKQLGFCLAPQPRCVLPHLRNGDWNYIYELLKEQIIQPNAAYVDLNGNAYTLLDIATLLGYKEQAEVLRVTYGVLKHETHIQRMMFQAAKEKNWEMVYQFLNEKAERVDYADSQTQTPCLLLHYAFLQRDADVIVTLIDEYQADVELLLNIDGALYESVLGVYEYAKTERTVEQLSAALQDITIGQSCEVLPNEVADSSKFMTPGFDSSSSTLSGIGLLRKDFPSEDESLTFRGQRISHP